MKKGIDEIWADNHAQGVRDKILNLEFMGSPYVYTVSVKTIFRDPKKKAIKKIRKLAEEWNYQFIFYKHYRSFLGERSLFKRGDLTAVLYRRGTKERNVFGEIQEQGREQEVF